MRKTIAVTAATGALLMGGAGIANAEPVHAPATTTTVAAEEYGDSSDNTGLWGLTGLLGLLGLLGLKNRRNDTDRRVGAGTSMGNSGTTQRPPTV